MKMNDLRRLDEVHTHGRNEIHIEPGVREKAERAIRRMVEFGQAPAH